MAQLDGSREVILTSGERGTGLTTAESDLHLDNSTPQLQSKKPTFLGKVRNKAKKLSSRIKHGSNNSEKTRSGRSSSDSSSDSEDNFQIPYASLPKTGDYEQEGKVFEDGYSKTPTSATSKDGRDGGDILAGLDSFHTESPFGSENSANSGRVEISQGQSLSGESKSIERCNPTIKSAGPRQAEQAVPTNYNYYYEDPSEAKEPSPDLEGPPSSGPEVADSHPLDAGLSYVAASDCNSSVAQDEPIDSMRYNEEIDAPQETLGSPKSSAESMQTMDSRELHAPHDIIESPEFCIDPEHSIEDTDLDASQENLESTESSTDTDLVKHTSSRISDDVKGDMGTATPTTEGAVVAQVTPTEEAEHQVSTDSFEEEGHVNQRASMTEKIADMRDNVNADAEGISKGDATTVLPGGSGTEIDEPRSVATDVHRTGGVESKSWGQWATENVSYVKDTALSKLPNSENTLTSPSSPKGQAWTDRVYDTVAGAKDTMVMKLGSVTSAQRSPVEAEKLPTDQSKGQASTPDDVASMNYDQETYASPKKSLTRSIVDTGVGLKDTIVSSIGYGASESKSSVQNVIDRHSTYAGQSTERGQKSMTQGLVDTGLGIKDGIASTLGYGPSPDSRAARRAAEVKYSTVTRFTPGDDEKALSQAITESLSNFPSILKGKFSGSSKPLVDSSLSSSDTPISTNAHSEAATGMVGRVTESLSSLWRRNPPPEAKTPNAIDDKCEKPA